MNTIDMLTKKILNFRDKREWNKYHTPKNLAISLVVEVGELLEYFQWKDDKEIIEYLKKAENKASIEEELADIFIYLLLLAHELDINIGDATLTKIEKNEKRYPVEQVRGKFVKYTELNKK